MLDLDPVAVGPLAGVLPGGRRAWRAAAERSSDAKTTTFVLYSGKEVRPDRMKSTGDMIAVREFRLANYRANPVVLADHNPSQVIGTGTAKIVETDAGLQLQGSPTWDLHESNPLAILIAGQHERGVRNAVSIGFMPGKGSVPRTKLAADHPAYLDPETHQSWSSGWYHRNPDLYEWSSVAVPKDPSALELQSWAASTEDPDERLRRIVGEILDSRSRDVVLAAVRHDPTVRAAIHAAAWMDANSETLSTSTATGDWFAEW